MKVSARELKSILCLMVHMSHVDGNLQTENINDSVDTDDTKKTSGTVKKFYTNAGERLRNNIVDFQEMASPKKEIGIMSLK